MGCQGSQDEEFGLGLLEVESLDSEAAGALCCATAIRIGGALGILAEGVGLAGCYRRIDRGLRKMLQSYQGGRPESDAVAEAFAASWHLGTIFPSGHEAARFFVAGLNVADSAIMASKAQDKGELLEATLQRALETVRLWPRAIQTECFSDIINFESSCQANALILLRSDGILALSERTEVDSLLYRDIAKSLEN